MARRFDTEIVCAYMRTGEYRDTRGPDDIYATALPAPFLWPRCTCATGLLYGYAASASSPCRVLYTRAIPHPLLLYVLPRAFSSLTSPPPVFRVRRNVLSYIG